MQPTALWHWFVDKIHILPDNLLRFRRITHHHRDHPPKIRLASQLAAWCRPVIEWVSLQKGNVVPKFEPEGFLRSQLIEGFQTFDFALLVLENDVAAIDLPLIIRIVVVLVYHLVLAVLREQAIVHQGQVLPFEVLYRLLHL